MCDDSNDAVSSLNPAPVTCSGCYRCACKGFTPDISLCILFLTLHCATVCYRRCAAEVEELNHSVMGAAELLLQHASNMRAGMKELGNRVGSLCAEVRTADALLS